MLFDWFRTMMLMRFIIASTTYSVDSGRPWQQMALCCVRWWRVWVLAEDRADCMALLVVRTSPSHAEPADPNIYAQHDRFATVFLRSRHRRTRIPTSDNRNKKQKMRISWGTEDMIWQCQSHYPVMMQYANISWHIERSTATDEFPYEMIACLDYRIRFANVLGPLLLRMQLGASTNFFRRIKSMSRIEHQVENGEYLYCTFLSFAGSAMMLATLHWASDRRTALGCRRRIAGRRRHSGMNRLRWFG